jgi:hypothetical protein
VEFLRLVILNEKQFCDVIGDIEILEEAFFDDNIIITDGCECAKAIKDNNN